MMSVVMLNVMAPNIGVKFAMNANILLPPIEQSVQMLANETPMNHSPDASTFPGFKLMCFVSILYFLEKTALEFNGDTCSHLALRLYMMLLHYKHYSLFRQSVRVL
jgi:hypothetical protein